MGACKVTLHPSPSICYETYEINLLPVCPQHQYFVFCAVRVVSKELWQLVLRTSLFELISY
jgi:hypothetical protein